MALVTSSILLLLVRHLLLVAWHLLLFGGLEDDPPSEVMCSTLLGRRKGPVASAAPGSVGNDYRMVVIGELQKVLQEVHLCRDI